ncbi:MAG: hypothetical protein Q8Q09_07080 [Deltaproteobacteria bacterium]|nr:hypothetical protein [Deltaproteobacteria bacterium]
MNRRWLGAFVGCAAVVLSAREASACIAPRDRPDGCRGWELNNAVQPIGLVGLLVAAPSLATDVAILGWAAHGQGIPRPWAIAGTVIWGAHTIVSATTLGIVAANVGNQTEYLVIPLPYTIVSAASLGLSLWALANPYREAATQRALSLGVMPWVSPQSTGITLAGRF